MGDLFFDFVMVASRGVANDQLAEESGEEQLSAEYHQDERNVEVGGVGDKDVVEPVGHVVDLCGADHDDGNETEDEHEGSEKPEEVHGLNSELVGEPECGKIKVAVDETVEPELCRAIFACAVLHNLFANAVESGIFGEIGNVAVHVAVDFDVLDDFVAIRLEPAVEVVEIADSGNASCRGIEQLCGDGLGQGVVALLFPSRHEVKAFVDDHASESGNLVGGVLKVGVHCDDDITFGAKESGVERRRLAVVAAEGYAADGGVGFRKAANDVP